MSRGEAFSASQRHDIDRGISEAERLSGRVFSVYVGPADGPTRAFAQHLHGQLANPDLALLIFVDPQARALEVVTGSQVAQNLSNRQVALACLSMQSSFAAGDLTRGLLSGLQQLAEFARPETLLHADTP
ncbi:MAG: DUF5130 family protein [Nocardioidaceae bacterium]